MKSILQTTVLVLIALIVAAPTVLAGETYVAKRDVQMKTATALFKFPVDAMRGDRWELVKRTETNIWQSWIFATPISGCARRTFPHAIPT